MANGDFPSDYSSFRYAYDRYIFFGLSPSDAVYAATEFDGLINYERIGLEPIEWVPATPESMNKIWQARLDEAFDKAIEGIIKDI